MKRSISFFLAALFAVSAFGQISTSNASGATAYLLDVDLHFEIDKPGSDHADPTE